MVKKQDHNANSTKGAYPVVKLSFDPSVTTSICFTCTWSQGFKVRSGVHAGKTMSWCSLDDCRVISIYEKIIECSHFKSRN